MDFLLLPVNRGEEVAFIFVFGQTHGHTKKYNVKSFVSSGLGEGIRKIGKICKGRE